MVVINLDLGDVKLKNWMLVEKCKHTYKEGEHWMDLTLRGGEFVCPELERRISEALAVDERITGVTDFEFDLTVKGVVHAYFTVKTIYGDIKAEKGVKI